MSGVLLEYHLIWLAAHPHRTADWLRDRMADGFDIHHLDWDHENDDPRNLVLVDCADHWMIHNGGRPIETRASRPKVNWPTSNDEPIARKPAKWDHKVKEEWFGRYGRAAYELRCRGLPWPQVALGLTGKLTDYDLAERCARHFALVSSKRWPVEIRGKMAIKRLKDEAGL